jgi:HAD superfamily hydrolase (TIGR01509 family)
MEEMKRKPPERYEESIALVRTLRAQEVRTAVVSSSRNCAEVLEAAGIAGLFEVRVDGNDILRLGMRGKPAPDAFLEAARRLGVDPSRAVVVEDAIAGVEAGRAGHFGLVVGVDRSGRSQELRDAGADVVVTSLAQVQAAVEPPSAWSLVYEDFDPVDEGVRESLCTLGNGYFSTRGAAPWAAADDVHYPGTYVAGGYNRLRTDILGRTVENEDLVNFPNWLALNFRVAGQGWFDAREVSILSWRQELDLSRGILVREIRFEDGQGRRSRLSERRLVSMGDKHLAALELSLTAENWSGNVTVRSAIDGRVINAGARLYREFNNRHLVPLGTETVGGDGVFLSTRASQSNLHVGQAARTRAYLDGKFVDVRRRVIEEPGYVALEMKTPVVEGQTLVVEKVASLYTSRDQAVSECGLAARKAIVRAGGFEELLAEHALAWKHLWRRFDVHLRPAGEGFLLNVPMLLRLNMFHQLQAVSPIPSATPSPSPRGAGRARPTRYTSSGTSCSSSRSSTTGCPRSPRAPDVPLPAPSRGAGGAPGRGARGGDVPLAERQRRSGGDPGIQPEPALPEVGEGQLWLQRHVGSAVAYNVGNITRPPGTSSSCSTTGPR